MLEVTETAVTNIKEYLHQQKVASPVRIVMSGGCSGPSLGLALDEAKENDLTFEQDTVRFVVDKALVETCGTIKVDYIESNSGCGCSGGGFTITSKNPLSGESGGRCGCSCTSGSCS